MYKKILLGLAGLLFASSASAWVTQSAVHITALIQFEAGISRDYTLIEFSSGERCRVLHTEKELLALVLSLYAMDKPVNIVCYDTQDDPGASGYLSRKLHRITGV